MNELVIKRVIKGLGANAYGQILVVVIQLAGVPILLHYWGVQLYGEWLILFAIPSYLSMTDLGFSLSAANDMTARVARSDKAGALAVFQSLSALVYLVAIVGVLIISLLIATLPIQGWFGSAMLSTMEIRWILWLLAAEMLVKLIDGVNHAGFRASGEYPLHVSINYTTLLLQHAGVWVVAAMGLGPAYAAAWFLLARVFITPSVTIFLFRRHRYLKAGFAHARMIELRKLARPALANIAMPLAQALNIQGMVLIVGAILGPIAVVTFSTLRTLTRLATQLVLSVSHAVEPELARAQGANNIVLTRKLYIHGLRLSFWTVLIAIISLYFFGEWIVTIWTQGNVKMDSALFSWLLLSSALTIFWYSGLNLLKAANRHLQASIWYSALSLIAVIVAALLLNSTGYLANAGLALVLMDVLMVILLLRKASKLLDMSIIDMFRYMLARRLFFHTD